MYEHFSKRFEELFQEKSKAESKVINYMTEVSINNQKCKLKSIHNTPQFHFQCEILKTNIELLCEEIEEKGKKFNDLKASFTRLEEDFITTRVNYEEQICVLTDQVINLSDQLARR